MASSTPPSSIRHTRTLLSHITPTRPCARRITSTIPSTASSQLQLSLQSPHTQHVRARARAHARLFHTTTPQHARLIRRPKVPYTFTQLIQLSDGSYVTTRTTSPAPLYKSTRDVRNAPLWNPSDKSLVGVEKDEAGRLREFRRRFGRSWDLESPAPTPAAAAPAAAAAPGIETEAGAGRRGGQDEVTRQEGAQQVERQGRGIGMETEEQQREVPEENLLDLISAYGKNMDAGVTRAMQSGTISKKVKKK